MQSNDINIINEQNRADIDQLDGPTMIEFGAAWCGYCQATQPMIASALINFPMTRHIKIEDAKGHRLGRSYSVKLWPTLIFLKNGLETRRIVRPANSEVIIEALAKINIE